MLVVVVCGGGCGVCGGGCGVCGGGVCVGGGGEYACLDGDIVYTVSVVKWTTCLPPLQG